MEKKVHTPQILIYCEGSSDKSFVNSIKCAYGNDPRFVVQGGQGGSPEEVIKRCTKVLGEYQRYCVVDAIPKITAKLRAGATKTGIIIVEISPYLECIELNFLEDTDKYLKGTDKNSAKKRIKTYVAEQNADELGDILKEVVTISTLKAKRNRLDNFTVIVDLCAKYKQSSYKNN